MHADSAAAAAAVDVATASEADVVVAAAEPAVAVVAVGDVDEHCVKPYCSTSQASYRLKQRQQLPLLVPLQRRRLKIQRPALGPSCYE